MKQKVLSIFLLVIFLIGGSIVFFRSGNERLQEKSDKREQEKTLSESPTKVPEPIPLEYRLSGGTYSAQTFNNCGPASLSMALSFQSKYVTQAQLASILRPYNNPLGGIDDKAVFAEELVLEAQRQGLESLMRPNGTIPLMQELLAQDISIIVRTWLNQTEDIGHYRVLTGYNQTTNEIYMDDSYNGPNISLSEDLFLTLWQPFNYGYIIIYPKEKADIVAGILGEQQNEITAWESSVTRAEEELLTNPQDPYALFNKAVAKYYLGSPEETTVLYEQALENLPGRMLWYQIEPIYAYYETKQYDIALDHIDSILMHGNLAFSELHIVKGNIYRDQGNIDQAKRSYENAILYNENYQKAKDSLNALSS